MFNLFLLISAFCLSCVCLKYLLERDSSPHDLPPALPGALPVIGYAHKLLKDPIVIVDPQDSLTAANACLQKHYSFEFTKDWAGDGLLTSKGEIWKRHRKLLIPSFTLSVVHGFLGIFNSQSKKLVTAVEHYVGKGPFDHWTHLKNNALDTLCLGTFGIDAINDEEFTTKYTKSVEELLSLTTSRTVKFWLHSDFLYKVFGWKKKEKELVKSLNAMTNKVITAATLDASSSINIGCTETKHKPFIELLLELSANGDFTDKEVREEITTIIAAGFETTSNQLTFTLALLGSHPEVQDKVYEEITEVLGADRDVEKYDLNQLIYTNAVLMESLRLYPSVPALYRYVNKDTKLRNYTMRAGSQCVILPLATQLDPAWGPESDQFKPERWLHDELRNNKEFAAFGLGKRACIGRTYAMISMKVTLAHFLRQYRVKADISQMQMKYVFVLKPVSGYEISIERRT